jgi:plastocyanin
METAPNIVEVSLGRPSRRPIQAKKLNEEHSRIERTLTMTKKTLWLASLPAPVLIAMLLLFPGSRKLTAGDRPASANTEVKIDNFVFGPQTITVPVGATVTWTNRDDIPHTSVSTEGVFKSKVLDTDEKFSYTFTKAGTYSYYCTIHPKMTGQVIVQ